MEYNLQAVFIGIAQYLFIKLHRLLLVTAKEINLNTFHANLLHPFHITLAGYAVIHHTVWTLWSVVHRSIAVIPKQ